MMHGPPLVVGLAVSDEPVCTVCTSAAESVENGEAPMNGVGAEGVDEDATDGAAAKAADDAAEAGSLDGGGATAEDDAHASVESCAEVLLTAEDVLDVQADAVDDEADVEDD